MSKDLSKNIRDIMDSLNIRFPIAYLSDKTGFSQDSVSRFYNGKRTPSRKFLKIFSQVFGIDLEKYNTKKAIDYITVEDLERLNKVDRVSIIAYIKAYQNEFKSMKEWQLYEESLVLDRAEKIVNEKIIEKKKLSSK